MASQMTAKAFRPTGSLGAIYNGAIYNKVYRRRAGRSLNVAQNCLCLPAMPRTGCRRGYCAT